MSSTRTNVFRAAGALVVALAFGAIGLLASMSGRPDISVEAYPVAGRPSAIAVDGERVWVADDLRNVVHALNASSGRETERTIAVHRNPIALSAGPSAVWVAHATGDLTRIDPVTGRAKASHVGDSLTDVVYAGGHVWACDLGSGDVLKIDPRSLAVVGRTKSVGGVQITATGDALWVTTQESTVVRISFGGEREGAVPAGAGPIGLASDGRQLWVANTDDGTVTRIDEKSAKVVGVPIRVGRGPLNVVVRRGIVWVSNQDDRTVTRINARTARVIETPTPVVTHVRGMAASGGGVWLVGTDPGRAVRLSE